MLDVRNSNRWLRRLLPISWLILAIIPGYVFFSARGGFAVFEASTARELAGVIFPLFGLYALFSVWSQLVIGSNMRYLRKIFPNIQRFHQTEGIFVFLFAWTHPLLIGVAFGMQAFFNKQAVFGLMARYIIWGQLALLLLSLSVGAALLRNAPWMKRWWRYIHYLNYAMFWAAFYHSYKIGSDVRALRGLWLFFGLTALATELLRAGRAYRSYSIRRLAAKNA